MKALPNNRRPQDTLDWKTFLEKTAPGVTCNIGDGVQVLGESAKLLIPALELYCGADICGGIRFFDSGSSEIRLGEDPNAAYFLRFRCRHCNETAKLYALIAWRSSAHLATVLKIGEWPSFGPHVPTKMFSLLGEDQETFHKGRRAESQGMGIGAFAYYRRVVENQKNRLIDEIIKVSEVLKASPDQIDNLRAARNETQFHKAVAIIKEGIPEVLRISGHNPLTLLHTALSDGLHDKTDEECLARAAVIRTVMGEMAGRIVEALREEAELNQAVSKLLEIQTSAKTKVNRDSKEQPGGTST